MVWSFGDSVHDDIFISFRYARNLVDGHGLVFNPSERVEGYTNFLWTVLVAAGMAVGIEPVSLVRGGSVLAGAGCAVLAWTMAERRYAIVAAVLIATNTAFAMEATQGLETCFFSALCGLAIMLRSRELEDRDPFPSSGLVAGAAVLTRPEGVLLFVLMEGLPLLADRGALRGRWRAWAGFAALLLPHLAFRISFYGELVPNTFHTKVIGVEHWDPSYLLAFCKAHPAWVLLAVVGAITSWRADRGRALLLIGPCAAWALWIWHSGGDYKPTHRFFAPILVPLAVLAANGVARIASGRFVIAAAAIVLAVGPDFAWGWPKYLEYAKKHEAQTSMRLTAGQFLRERYEPGTWVAMHAIGAVPWASGLPTIDMWGLTDAHIAKVDAKPGTKKARGHQKVDYDYVFGRNPEVYFPHDGSITEEPHTAPVPRDFPEDFEDRYKLVSYKYKGLWIQVFERKDLGKPR